MLTTHPLGKLKGWGHSATYVGGKNQSVSELTKRSSVSRMGKILAFSYFLIECIKFFHLNNKLPNMFWSFILTFKGSLKNWLKFSIWVLIFWPQFWLHFQKLGNFLAFWKEQKFIYYMSVVLSLFWTHCGHIWPVYRTFFIRIKPSCKMSLEQRSWHQFLLKGRRIIDPNYFLTYCIAMSI